jgi:hypothetical protein
LSDRCMERLRCAQMQARKVTRGVENTLRVRMTD